MTVSDLITAFGFAGAEHDDLIIIDGDDTMTIRGVTRVEGGNSLALTLGPIPEGDE